MRVSQQSGRQSWLSKRFPRAPDERCGFFAQLLDRASSLREHRVCVRAYKSYRANYDHENDGQHHCLLCDVLTLFIPEECEKGR